MPGQPKSTLRVLLVLAALCQWSSATGAAKNPTEPADAGELDAWSKGPARWLLVPAEVESLKEVSSPAEAVRFLERFWARRDPDPTTEANPFREDFYRRVEAADLLYPENGVRGSLTDRGRALILLGSPTGLRVTSQEALAWDPATGSADNVKVRYLPLEIWSYQRGDFRRPLDQALMALGDAVEYRVSFVRESGRTTLSEGEELLDLAQRTALALYSEP